MGAPGQPLSVDSRIVIVGAGHAGGTAAALLRQYGHRGHIVLLGEEAKIPYQRPPLSKAYLKREAAVDELYLRSETFYHDNGIVLQLGARAVSIDPRSRSVALDGGDVVAFDSLVLATGSRARPLAVPGIELKGVHELRNIADADALIAGLQPGRHLAIIGGGYVGLEVAASARALGAAVTLIEREPRILARVACLHLSTFFETYHRFNGVKIETSTDVRAIAAGDDGRAAGVILGDGRHLHCDAVLVGIGGVPCSELASAAGITCQGGVVVDEDSRTSDPAIFAIGDVTSRPLPLYGGRRCRLESVQNAIEQARQCAAAITGHARPAHEVPWFWSDQYDLKLQIAGLPFDADRQVVRALDDKKFAVFHLAGPQLRAVEAVNAPLEFMHGKKLIGSGAALTDSRLADASIPMTEICA